MEDRKDNRAKSKLGALGGDVAVYMAGSILLIVFSSAQLILLAKYLPVEDFGYYQAFMLYSTYVGILHLGLLDGLLLRWAGKTFNQIFNEIKTAFRFLLIEQLVISIIAGIIIFFVAGQSFQFILFLLLVFSIIFNLVTFFMFIFQAVMKFRLLTGLTVTRSFIFIAVLLFILPSVKTSFQVVIMLFILSYLLLMVAMQFYFNTLLRKTSGPGKEILLSKKTLTSSISFGIENIFSGSFVLLGNLVVTFMITIDRLMVNANFTIQQFAIYAFASNIIIVVNTLVKSVSDVLFPYLSNYSEDQRKNIYGLSQSMIIIITAAILIVYFPARKVLELYLPEYASSLSILQILLCSLGFSSLIQVIQINYFRIYRIQRRYFILGVAALVFSIIVIFTVTKLFFSLESVAVAIFCGYFLWYILNELSLHSRISPENSRFGKIIIFNLIYIGSFWLISLLIDSIFVQVLAYAAVLALLYWLFFKDIIRGLVSPLAAFIHGEKNKRIGNG